MMANIRLLQENEFDAAIRLADSIFRDDEHRSMRDAYPFVFSPSLRQSYGAFVNDELVAFMGFVPAVVQVGEARLHIYSIGAVCTHPDARGNGYASQLLSSVFAHADAAGASLILVSGKRSLYARAGCYPFGRMKKYTLNQDNIRKIRSLSGDVGIRIREWRATDLFKLVELMRTRTAYYEQSVNDLAALIRAEAFASNVKMQHTLLVAERQGEPVAFVIMATGDKASARTPFIIEWAGEPEATAAILGHAIRAYDLPNLDIHVNWFETGLNEVLESIPALSERNSGTVHIVNAEHLYNQLGPYWRARGTAGSDLATMLQDMDDADRIALLFDPTVGENGHHSALPIPFPYTVGLNYV
ncbi:GNAT family acetyltransferase [Paenibacillus agaridevorans]|uniref:GNAT family acetyltransferase n=1 Tax=Paenibacillus agaridevorans TaxID=171404 RepID=A0A2R5ET63_9BACL|nr:GNAT family N-acetyltransferase [Paenibacillus agaridevorans]GBG08228.1 GNAT family acetyltransferase [Paenibacillus agaridevorans]